MSFTETRIGDVLTFQRGFDITKAEQFEGAIPIVSSSGTSSYHNHWKVAGPGIVIGRKGTLGTTHFLASNFWPHDTTLWVKDFKGNDPKFLYYFLKTLHLENFDTGSSNPTLNRNHVHKITVRFPVLLEIQQKIAAILSVYDDLIANNQRRITLRERMAEDIYREWFVRLRFPGHKQVKFERGVPQGWNPSTLGAVADFTMGQSPSSEYFNDAGNGLPFHQGVGSYGPRYPSHETFCSVSGRKAKPGDILFSVRAPVGRINIADRELIIGRSLAAIRHKRGMNGYLLYLLKVTFASEDIIGNGSIFNSVGKDELARLGVFEPSIALVEKFEALVQPIDQKVAALYQATASLKTTRDALLPRLISGKLAVDGLDIRFPPGMVDSLDKKAVL
jgi:type I restriction enzyme, S subunit